MSDCNYSSPDIYIFESSLFYMICEPSLEGGFEGLTEEQW